MIGLSTEASLTDRAVGPQAAEHLRRWREEPGYADRVIQEAHDKHARQVAQERAEASRQEALNAARRAVEAVEAATGSLQERGVSGEQIQGVGNTVTAVAFGAEAAAQQLAASGAASSVEASIPTVA